MHQIMIKKLNTLFQTIGGLGSTSDMDRATLFKVSVMNRLIFSVAALCSGLNIVYVVLGISDLLIPNLIFTIVFLVESFLIYKGYYKVVWHFSIIMPLLAIIANSVILHVPVMMIIFLFPIVLSIYFLFENYYRRIYQIVILLIILFIVLYDRYIYHIVIDRELNTYIVLLSIIVVITIQSYLSRERDYYAQSLLDNQKILNNAQSVTQSASWVFNALNNEFTCSEQLCDVLYAHPDPNKPLIESFMSMIPASNHHYFNTENTDAQFSFEFKREIDGKSNWFEVTAARQYSDKGEPVGMIGIVQNITKRKNNTRKLKYSSTLLSASLEASDNGIVIVDIRGVIRHFNKRAVEIWNIPETMIGGSNDSIIQHVANQLKNPEAYLTTREEIKQNPENTYEDELETIDGRVIKRLSNPYYIDGKIQGLSWTFTDVTDLKRQEGHIQDLINEIKRQNDQLSKFNKELVKSNHDLEQFAYIASHDLQEPLRMIGNFIQLIDEEYGDKLGQDGKFYIEYAVESAKRLSRKLDELLDYSLVGSKSVDIEIINLKDVVSEVLRYDDLSAIITSHNAEVQLHNIGYELKVGKKDLCIIFYHLISNAIKYNDKEKPIITISAQQKDTSIEIYVQDNGIGIEKANHDKIFNIFKRLHRKEEYEGTGIGLALVKKIIEKNNGKIWLESKEGEGTTFIFNISI